MRTAPTIGDFRIHPRVSRSRRVSALPDYDTSMALTADSRRQAVLMMNQDATTLAKPAYALYVRLMQKAFCGSNTATTPYGLTGCPG